jgi:uncharacterized protein
MVTPELLAAILAQYKLRVQGIHGAAHWARVLDNGRRLSGSSGARLDVVELFAVFHDACRWNDGWAPNHGAQGANLAARMRGQYYEIDDAGYELLLTACRLHTDGLVQGDLSVQVCWDSDRLDLGRAGFRIDPAYLCTPQARLPEVIAWADERGRGQYIPVWLKGDWGIDLYQGS